MSPNVDRRHLIAGVLASSMLTGCSVADRYTKRLSQINDMRKFYMGNGGRPDVGDKAFVESIPFSSIKLSVRGVANGLMTLSHSQASGLTWAASDGFAVTTHNGRLLKTAGFASNMTRTDFVIPDPLADSSLLNGEPATMTRKCDFQGLGFDIILRSKFRAIKEETIEILGVEYETLRVRESGKATGINWGFSNEYWLDAKSGFVWKSKQHGHPLMRRKFTIVTLRPYSKDASWLKHLSMNKAPKNAIEI